MDTAEDAAKILFITKRKDALLAASALALKWEDMMVGPKKLELEEVRELVEWDIWRIFLVELKMDSALELHPNPKIVKLIDWFYCYMGYLLL
jgi:hypothetical protein